MRNTQRVNMCCLDGKATQNRIAEVMTTDEIGMTVEQVETELP